MKISYAQEMELCKALLTAHGMNADDAGLLGESVAHSDFTGIYSHGLSRFANYLKRFENGAMKPNAKLSVAMDGGSTVAFDCDNGCGVVVMYRAYERMVERARKYGIVIATGRRASNIGCGSFFAKRAVEDGLIAMFCCNTVRCVAPYGGADSLLGTNPIVIAAPAGEELPLILDISTTVTAMGKIQAAAREGKPIPAGWALDADGKPTTDSAAAKTVLPIAGPKGYGLAVMIEMFSALLAGASYGDGVGFPNKGEAENTGFAMILVDPRALYAPGPVPPHGGRVHPLDKGQPQGRGCVRDTHARRAGDAPLQGNGGNGLRGQRGAGGGAHAVRAQLGRGAAGGGLCCARGEPLS